MWNKDWHDPSIITNRGKRPKMKHTFFFVCFGRLTKLAASGACEGLSRSFYSPMLTHEIHPLLAIYVWIRAEIS